MCVPFVVIVFVVVVENPLVLDAHEYGVLWSPLPKSVALTVNTALCVHFVGFPLILHSGGVISCEVAVNVSPVVFSVNV